MEKGEKSILVMCSASGSQNQTEKPNPFSFLYWKSNTGRKPNVFSRWDNSPIFALKNYLLHLLPSLKKDRISVYFYNVLWIDNNSSCSFLWSDIVKWIQVFWFRNILFKTSGLFLKRPLIAKTKPS